MKKKQKDREQNRHETGVYRLNTFVVPLLACNGKDTRVMMEKLLAEKNKLSQKTVHRYYMAYINGGFDALMPKKQDRSATRVIPDKILNEAISMREVVPSRSVEDIIFTLEMEGLVDKGAVKRSTLQNNLEEAGYSRRQMKDRTIVSEQAVFRFQKKHRMDLVQCDIKEGAYAVVDGKVQEVYWISWIDDCSRYLLGGRFFPKESEIEVMQSLREMISIYGKPKKIYADNGGPYISKLFSGICANLGIKLIHHLPRNCQAKGKVERMNGTLDSFVNECFNTEDFTLKKMNAYFKAWEDVGYLDYPHEGLDKKTPRSVFDSDPTPLRMVTEEELEKAFIRREVRKVSKSSTISYKSRTYQISDINMKGLYVTIEIQPLTGEILSVKHPGYEDATAKLCVIGENIDFEAKGKAGKAQLTEKERKAREKNSRVLMAFRTGFLEKYPESTLFDGIDDEKEAFSEAVNAGIQAASKINFNAFVDKEEQDD